MDAGTGGEPVSNRGPGLVIDQWRMQLVQRTQSYVQVQWEANWEANRTGGGSNFTVLTSSPEAAQQYLPTLTNLGQR